jgi:hypothetical protein
MQNIVANLPKSIVQWWKNEPRTGCRCASLTKKRLDEKFVFIQESNASTVIKSFLLFVVARKKSAYLRRANVLLKRLQMLFVHRKYFEKIAQLRKLQSSLF